MNKVFQIFEEEKQEAVNEAVNKTRIEEKREFAEKLLEMDLETVQIMKATGLTRKQVEEVKEKMSVTKQQYNVSRNVWQQHRRR